MLKYSVAKVRCVEKNPSPWNRLLKVMSLLWYQEGAYTCLHACLNNVPPLTKSWKGTNRLHISSRETLQFAGMLSPARVVLLRSPSHLQGSRVGFANSAALEGGQEKKIPESNLGKQKELGKHAHAWPTHPHTRALLDSQGRIHLYSTIQYPCPSRSPANCS